MTYDIKLDQIFNTVDTVVLRQSIIDNYLVRKGVTTLIDKLNRSSVVIFDAVNKEWRDGNKVINTTLKTTFLPFSVAKIHHDMMMNCSCGEDYADRFNTIVDSIVDAYTLTMIPIARQQQIDQLEAALIPLEQQQADALADVQVATTVVVDDQLEDMKNDLLDKERQINSLNQTIVALNNFHTKMIQDKNNISNLWGLVGNGFEDTAARLVATAKQQNIYTNQLKTPLQIQQTLTVANARLQNLTADKDSLDQQIATREDQNEQTRQARELAALRGLSAVATQISRIRAQLDAL